MKNIFILLLFLPFVTLAQPNVALCLQKSNNRLQVRLIPDANFQGLPSEVRFTIESSDPNTNFGTIMQSVPENQYIPIEKAGNDTIVGGKKYQTFVGFGLINMSTVGINKTWQANMPYTIMELIPSNMNANFSIAHNAYTNASNRDAYIELNGNSRTGLITCNPNPLSNAIQLAAEWKENDAFLQWIDAKRLNVKSYIIERADGNENYQIKDSVLATQSFYYDNKRKLSNVAQYMYRIKALSYNGEESFSNVETLWITNDLNVSLSPNPAKTNLNLHIFDNNSASYKLVIVTSEGKQVYENTFSNFEINIPLESFASGVYFAEIMTDNGRSKQLRFIKE